MNYEATPANITANMATHGRELQDVFTERLRQLRKFGPQNRPPYQWFLILSEEVGEVAKECVELEFDDAAHPHADPERYYKELTEVAAVALAAMQNFNQRRAPAAPKPMKLPSKETLLPAFNARYGKPDRPLEIDDIRDVMEVGGELQVQVSIYGFTDWYAVQLNDASQPDPTTITQLPF